MIDISFILIELMNTVFSQRKSSFANFVLSDIDILNIEYTHYGYYITFKFLKKINIDIKDIKTEYLIKMNDKVSGFVLFKENDIFTIEFYPIDGEELPERIYSYNFIKKQDLEQLLF